MISYQTIGVNLSRIEENVKKTIQREETKRMKRMNTLIVWITILLIGIGLGYKWRMIQTTSMIQDQQQEWVRSEILKHAFKPVEIIDDF